MDGQTSRVSVLALLRKGPSLKRVLGRTGRLGTNNPDVLPVSLRRDARPAQQTPSSRRRHDDIRLAIGSPDVGDLGEDLDNGCPLTLEDVDVVERGDEVDETSCAANLRNGDDPVIQHLCVGEHKTNEITFSISRSVVTCLARVSGEHSTIVAPYPMTPAFFALDALEGMMIVAEMGRSGVESSLAVRAICKQASNRVQQALGSERLRDDGQPERGCRTSV